MLLVTEISLGIFLVIGAIIGIVKVLRGVSGSSGPAISVKSNCCRNANERVS